MRHTKARDDDDDDDYAGPNAAAASDKPDGGLALRSRIGLPKRRGKSGTQKKGTQITRENE